MMIFFYLNLVFKSYVEQITDLVNEMVKVKRETDTAKQAELTKTLATEIVPNHLKIIEARLVKSGTGYLFSQLTWADLYLTVVLEWLGDKKEATLAHFPKLNALDQTVRGLPKIAEWIKKRPVTEF